MNSPNLQQRLYLARAMNEELEGIFDHDRQLSEAPTRKHFRQVADLIKANPAPAKRNELAKHHAEIFAKQNPRFDGEKFMKACDADGTCGSPAAPARYSPKNMSEGSYQGSQRELRGQRKGSRKLLRTALAKGDKKGAAEWMENIKDAESQIKPKKRVDEQYRYQHPGIPRGHLTYYGATPSQAKTHLVGKYGHEGYHAILKAIKAHKNSKFGSLAFTTADVHKAGMAGKNAAEARAAAAKNKTTGN